MLSEKTRVAVRRAFYRDCGMTKYRSKNVDVCSAGTYRKVLILHGNTIARRGDNCKVEINLCGYNTLAAKRWLGALCLPHTNAEFEKRNVPPNGWHVVTR